MTKINLDKLIKIILIFSVLLVTSSISYYFVIFLPEKEEAELELQKDKLEFQKAEQMTEWKVLLEEQKEKEENKKKLDLCLIQAFKDYSDTWNNECKSFGLGNGCNLSTDTAERFDKYHKELKDDCFKQFPQ